MECAEARALVAAAVDRELGVRDALAFDAHLAGCAACRAERDAQQGLRAAVHERGEYFTAPVSLQSRIRAALPSPQVPSQRPAWLRWPWLNAGAVLASLAAVAFSAGLLLTLPSADERIADDVVTSHVRGQLSGRAVDVASSDQHTVKPWFNGKLDFSPPVHDYASEGFALVGGRVDYLDHRTVAALIYRHRQHMIDVFVMPSAGAGVPAAATLSRQGYSILRWEHGGMTFWAVSDAEPAELDRLRDLLRQSD